MEWLSSIYFKLSQFVDGFINTISYIWGILQSIWYGLTTILTGLYDLVSQIFTSGIF